jgi:hypothetical protein
VTALVWADVFVGLDATVFRVEGSRLLGTATFKIMSAPHMTLHMVSIGL